jgi:hypothetical protein
MTIVATPHLILRILRFHSLKVLPTVLATKSWAFNRPADFGDKAARAPRVAADGLMLR